MSKFAFFTKVPICKAIHHRFLFVTVALFSQVKDGTVYRGIFHTANLEGKDVSVVLKMAKAIKVGTSKTTPIQAETVKTLIIHSSDLVQVVAEGISIGKDDSLTDSEDVAGFGTDAAIGFGRGGQVSTTNPILTRILCSCRHEELCASKMYTRVLISAIS